MIIIPARLASHRFPRKIMIDIGGMPMFIRSAKNAALVDEVVLAVDSTEAFDIANKYGIKAVMTDSNIPNGSLRVLEAARILGLSDHSIIINLQADEPFLETEVIETLRNSMQNGVFMATCARIINSDQAKESNIVKVLLDNDSNAIYFSRAMIPFDRDDSNNVEYLGHLGIYAYTKASLEEVSSQKETLLENIEKLEQLRPLYYGKKIKVNIVHSQSIGIDTMDDLDRAKRFYNLI